MRGSTSKQGTASREYLFDFITFDWRLAQAITVLKELVSELIAPSSIQLLKHSMVSATIEQYGSRFLLGLEDSDKRGRKASLVMRRRRELEKVQPPECDDHGDNMSVRTSPNISSLVRLVVMLSSAHCGGVESREKGSAGGSLQVVSRTSRDESMRCMPCHEAYAVPFVP